ncbi:MAG TPA: FHA domain-containing protein [Ktedonobacteraceae bacterium]|nr:FHA domain-containing protein [Ktedonobacteraceae bacterium]
MSNAMNMQFILHFSNGPLGGQAIPVTKTETRMGSDPHVNDLIVSDISMMPEHARIVIDSDRYIIQARNAQSLLVVNGQPVDYAVLQDRDQVLLGTPGVSFVVQLTPAASLTPPAAPAQFAPQVQFAPSKSPTPDIQFAASTPFAPSGSLAPDIQSAPPVQVASANSPTLDVHFVVPAPFAPSSSPTPDIQFAAPSSPLPAQFPPANDSPLVAAQSAPQFAFSQDPYAQQQVPSPIVYPPQTPLQVAYMETTRQICAAVHLDEHFQRFVVDTVVGEDHRALGEAYGVDIIPVLKVAYAARKRTFIRDSLLFVILLVSIIFILYSAASLIGALHTMTATPTANPLLPFASSAPSSANPFAMLSAALSTLFTLSAILSLFFYGLSVLIVSQITKLSSRRVRLGLICLLVLLVFFWSLIPFFVIAWIVIAIERAIRYHGSGTTALTKSQFHPINVPYSLDPQVGQRASAIFQPQDGNVVVYSGSSPFAGSGIRVGGWSFPIDITRGKREAMSTLKPKSFQIDEIYAYITDSLQKLDLDGKSELCGAVAFADKLYVNGQEIRNDTRFLPDPFARPYPQVHEQLMEQFMQNPTQDIRFYKSIRLTSWRGEMVLSIFYRFVMIANSLYVEVNYLLLPPLKASYSHIDTSASTSTLHKFWDIVRDSFLATAEHWLQSPAGVCRYLFASSLHSQQEKRARHAIQDNPSFDYGARTSLREKASGDYRQHFQYLDQEMSIKIIERQLLESLTAFLASRDIDTSDCKQRHDTLLNNTLAVPSNPLPSLTK